MPRLHALELLPDDAGAAAVRRDWQALRDAGLPSMLDHRGSTNTPHVTVVASPEIAPEVEQVAADTIGRLLPLAAPTSGLALLGGERVSLVRLVAAPDDLVQAVLDLRERLADQPHPGWLPHVTLARRLPRDRAPEALAVLDARTDDLVLTSLRRWDPDADRVSTLAQGVTGRRNPSSTRSRSAAAWSTRRSGRPSS